MDCIGCNQVKLTHNQAKLGHQIYQIGSYIDSDGFKEPYDEETIVPEVPRNLFKEEEKNDSLIESTSEGSKDAGSEYNGEE
ncbi:hypothetical protein LguiA_014821 [Lonicera macranthoides]